MGAATAIPLIILALLCLVGGLLDFPRFLGGSPFFGSFLGGALPPSPALDASEGMELILSLAPLLLTLFGIPIAWLIARNGLARETGAAASAEVPGSRGPSGMAAFVRGGFGFDRLYSFIFVRPITRLAGRGVDPVNLASEGVRALAMRVSRLLRLSQDGRPRRYLAVLALGAAILLAAVLI
jgi:hypothetical protein